MAEVRIGEETAHFAERNGGAVWLLPEEMMAEGVLGVGSEGVQVIGKMGERIIFEGCD